MKISERYIIDTEKPIGKGGMSTVFRAFDTEQEKDVAIKILDNNYVTNNMEVKQRFISEARILQSLSHPNIIQIYDWYFGEETHYIVTEYVEGQNLYDYIFQDIGVLPEKQAVNFFLQILNGIGYAHKHQIVHRDIKPSNFIISPATTAHNKRIIKILDFGISKVLSSTSTITRTDQRIGTTMYMSPEQILGKQVDTRSDIYSLGVLLYILVTGQYPYNRVELSVFQISKKIVDSPFPKPRDKNPLLSKNVQNIILKATNKNANKRFTTCQEFHNALTGKNNIANRKKQLLVIAVLIVVIFVILTVIRYVI